MTAHNDQAADHPADSQKETAIPSRRAADVPGDASVQPEQPERRRGDDRRQRQADRDDQGHVRSGNYTGPDRRTGLDRRAYLERQRKVVMQEKMRFIHRSTLTFAVFFFLIVLAGVFLLAPEYAWLKKRADNAAQDTPQAQVQPAPAAVPLGLAMNRQIARAENTVNGLSATTQAMIARAGEAGHLAAETARQLANGNGTGLRALVDFIGNTRQLAMSPQGRTQLDGAVGQLRGYLQNWQGDAAGFETAIAQARGADPALDSMLGSVATQDVGAAAMLLLMGEFRSNLGGERPFDQDLAVVNRLAGNNPELKKSLARLAPYAREGVLNRDTLQKEFSGLAMEIVTARLSGQDANVQDRAQARLNALVKVRKIDTRDGDSADAVVNRAQDMLAKGDINSAIRELQSLQGAQAQAAAPFIAQAQGTLAAQQSSDMLMNAVLGQLAAGGGVSLEGLKGLVTNSLGFDQPVSPVSGQ